MATICDEALRMSSTRGIRTCQFNKLVFSHTQSACFLTMHRNFSAYHSLLMLRQAIRAEGVYNATHNACASLSSPCDHYNTCNSSVSVSGSVSARKSHASAARAEILRLGSNSKQSSRNFTVFLISGAKASPCSGLVLEVDHWTSSNNEKPFWLTDGIVHSSTAPCNTAHCFSLRWPKMVAISIIASTSSVELKNGNLCARMVSSMTPTDHMSILVVCAVHLRRTSGARNPRVPARFARRDGLWSFLG